MFFSFSGLEPEKYRCAIPLCETEGNFNQYNDSIYGKSKNLNFLFFIFVNYWITGWLLDFKAQTNTHALRNLLNDNCKQFFSILCFVEDGEIDYCQYWSTNRTTASNETCPYDIFKKDKFLECDLDQVSFN